MAFTLYVNTYRGWGGGIQLMMCVNVDGCLAVVHPH